MDFTDDELRLILESLNCLNRENNLGTEDRALMDSVKNKIKNELNPIVREAMDEA